MQAEERDAAFVWDMLHAIRAIDTFIAGHTQASLAADELGRSGIHWQVIVLGEAARRVSRRRREEWPTVDWQLLFRQRNFYAHEYDETATEDLWAFVVGDIPGLRAAITALLSALAAEAPPGLEEP